MIQFKVQKLNEKEEEAAAKKTHLNKRAKGRDDLMYKRLG